MATSAHSGVWHPLLEGDLRAEAMDAIVEISLALARPPAAGGIGYRSIPADGKSTLMPSLAHGDAGLALFFAYRSMLGDGDDDVMIASHYLDRTFAMLNEQARATTVERTISSGLYHGFTGIAWVAAHFQNLTNEESLWKCDGIDRYLLRMLSRSPATGSCGLINGLAGMSAYALERLADPISERCLVLLVERLEERCERRSGLITWSSAPRHLPTPNLRGEHPHGCFDLGVGHGVPGIIGALSAIISAGVNPRRAQILLEGAIPWLIKQERPVGSMVSFDHYCKRRGPLQDDVNMDDYGAEGWRSGDVGVGMAMLSAARAMNCEWWELEAIRVLQRAAMRPIAHSGVHEPGLGQGAAGIAHLFNRAYQATGHGAFREASLRWYRQLLSLRRHHGAVAGFTAGIDLEDADGSAYPHAGFLAGAAGIGLALLAGVSAVEPRWDRVMLASVSPGNGLVQPGVSNSVQENASG